MRPLLFLHNESLANAHRLLSCVCGLKRKELVRVPKDALNNVKIAKKVASKKQGKPGGFSK